MKSILGSSKIVIPKSIRLEYQRMLQERNKSLLTDLKASNPSS
jgi:hypothetical protein